MPPPRYQRDRIKLSEKYPDIASEWDGEANSTFGGPDSLPIGSERRVGWRCRAGHTWQASVAARVYRGNACRICSPSRKRKADGTHTPTKPTPANSLKEVKPTLAAQWAPDNPYTTEDVGARSTYIAQWICRTCDTRWESAVITAKVDCPTCRTKSAGEKVQCKQCSKFWTHHPDEQTEHKPRFCQACALARRRLRREIAPEILRRMHEDLGVPAPLLGQAFEVGEHTVLEWIRNRRVPQKAVERVQTVQMLMTARLPSEHTPEDMMQVWKFVLHNISRQRSKEPKTFTVEGTDDLDTTDPVD